MLVACYVVSRVSRRWRVSRAVSGSHVLPPLPRQSANSGSPDAASRSFCGVFDPTSIATTSNLPTHANVHFMHSHARTRLPLLQHLCEIRLRPDYITCHDCDPDHSVTIIPATAFTYSNPHTQLRKHHHGLGQFRNGLAATDSR